VGRAEIQYAGWGRRSASVIWRARDRADSEKVEALAGAVRNYGNALTLAEDLYARGLRSFLEVLDAEQSLYSNQDSLASAEGQVLKDIVTMFRALGGGW